MKKLIYISALLLIVGCQKKTDIEILTDISNKLQQLEKIQYNFYFDKKDHQSPSASYSYSGTLAIDYTKENALGANVYSKRVKKGKKVFERLVIGDTLIKIKDETKTIVKSPNSETLILNGNVDLYFNVFDIRRSLPLVIQDSTMTSLKITDTILSETPALSVKFKIKKHIMGGELYDTKGPDNTYQLVVRKKDYVPLIWKLNNDDMNMTFSSTNIQMNIDNSLWNYNPQKEYTIISGKEYRLRGKKDLNKQLGKGFPDWQLSSIRGKKLSNKSFENKLTLYEFFFVGCIGSINAKPFIEELHKKYRKKLNIVSIEIQNHSQKEVLSFVKKHNLKEPAVFNGKKLASQLGVLGCPTFILVDKLGKIIFVSFGDKAGLKNLIEKEL
ncbi:MAG: TlpA disulfide reductase family protein [Cellulophaga sp.]